VVEKNAKIRLVELRLEALERERKARETPHDKLERLLREARLNQLSIKRLGAVWLNACRGIYTSTEDL
jgi:hypothetical protein